MAQCGSVAIQAGWRDRVQWGPTQFQDSGAESVNLVNVEA